MVDRTRDPQSAAARCTASSSGLSHHHSADCVCAVYGDTGRAARRTRPVGGSLPESPRLWVLCTNPNQSTSTGNDLHCACYWHGRWHPLRENLDLHHGALSLLHTITSLYPN